jgi:hypothetical protein
MENEFVTYNQALALKELGFDEPINAIWLTNANSELQLGFGSWINSNKSPDYLSAPLKQQAFRWFRDEYGYCSYLKEATKGTYRFYIDKFDEKFFNSDIFKTYEESEFLCIDKLIEIVKNK